LGRLGTSDGMRGLRLCCDLRAAGPHGPGLAALSLPGQRPTVRRGQRRAAEPDPMLERRHRSRGALALARPPHAPRRSEMFLQRGITFGHETVRNWEAKRTPVLTAELRQRRRGRGGAGRRSWHVDEHIQRSGAAGAFSTASSTATATGWHPAERASRHGSSQGILLLRQPPPSAPSPSCRRSSRDPAGRLDR
jgi:hypothetical protein